VNDALCRLVGRTREEIVGRDDFDLFAPDEAAAIQARDRQVLAMGTALRFETRCKNAGLGLVPMKLGADGVRSEPPPLLS
jgi:PAS domain-containing protein